MIKRLILRDVGPAPWLDVEFAPRLNLFTGDNGLGKSFLLDIAWWALTGTWAHYPAFPDRSPLVKPTITFELEGKSAREVTFESVFDRTTLTWKRKRGRPANPGLVLYARVDGSFSIWDPARNYWHDTPTPSADEFERPRAYHFTPGETWDGVPRRVGTDARAEWICNGLIRDWASWQGARSPAWHQLCRVLDRLAPSPDEPLVPGALTRISLDDTRDMPTLQMAYGKDVPVVHASSAVRRIISLAYLLVWTWQEHLRASDLRSQPPTRRVVLLVDEVEAHLHPAWQRRILRSLLDVIRALVEDDKADVQLLVVTHSPMLLASVEPFFDPKRDALWMFDLVRDDAKATVRLTRDVWHRRGDASAWLRSEVFDLKEARSVEAERAIADATALMANAQPSREDFDRLYLDLRRSMPAVDPFWVEWRAWAWNKGFLREQGP
jgi:hypothetical protein